MQTEAFIGLVLECLGSPSRNHHGPLEGCDPHGFDCSGLVCYVLKIAQYPDPIPRYASQFFDSFGILIHEDFRAPGDLVFFSNRGGTYPDHVGIVVTESTYIHSPGRDGQYVQVAPLVSSPIQPSKVAPRIYSRNPVGYKRITVHGGRYRKMFLVS